ncbi:MAG: PA14 domain-containing protein [Planctomycetota bacterium]|nr:PA14 domain-containing protein [Planctomycetota bacterium]
MPRRPVWQLACVLLVGSVVAASARAQEAPSVVPWPKSIQPGQGRLVLTAKGRIVTADKTLEPLAAIVSEEIELACNVRLAPGGGPAGAGDIRLAIDGGLKGDRPVGFTRMAAYEYNLLDRMPQVWTFTLYQADAKWKKAPDDLSGLGRLYAGTAAGLLLTDMHQVHFPSHLVCTWEGLTSLAGEGEYTFRLRSCGGTSRLFVDGKLLIDRTATDWGQDVGTARLAAGKHAVKVVRCGGAGYQSLNLVGPGGKLKPLDLETVQRPRD